MTLRDKNISELREQSIGTVSDHNSDEENFQNRTLRPILKMQSDLFLLVFIQYASINKNIFFGLDISKKLEYIEKSVTKDFKFRQFLIGLVAGLFTTDEFSYYSLNSSSLNKRIISMLSERLKSNIQLLNHSN